MMQWVLIGKFWITVSFGVDRGLGFQPEGISSPDIDFLRLQYKFLQDLFIPL